MIVQENRKTNYNKHMEKIFKCLSLSAEQLLGDKPNRLSRMRGLRSNLRMDVDYIASETGISEQELTEIESGGEATPAQLKDIALSLYTSVAGIQDKEFFCTRYDAREYSHGIQV